MSGGAKTVAWVIVGVLAVIVIMGSLPDKGIPEGHKGSYLGRAVQDLQLPNQVAQDLNKRAGSVQRF